MIGKLARHNRAEVVVPASPASIWRIISDVTRIGGWSHECTRAVWTGDEHRAVVGATFRGSNKSGGFKWARDCVFTEVDAPRQLVWRTGGKMGVLDQTEWRIRLEPMPGGTRLVQTYDLVHVAFGFDRIAWILIKGHRDRSEALVRDLERLGALAASEEAVQP